MGQSTFSGQGKRSRGVIHLQAGVIGAAACGSSGDRTVSLEGATIVTCKRCKELAARKGSIPAIGTRYTIKHGKGFVTTVEYVGPNPDKTFETADAHLVRVVETFTGGAPVGHTSAVDALWFDHHDKA